VHSFVLELIIVEEILEQLLLGLIEKLLVHLGLRLKAERDGGFFAEFETGVHHFDKLDKRIYFNAFDDFEDVLLNVLVVGEAVLEYGDDFEAKVETFGLALKDDAEEVGQGLLDVGEGLQVEALEDLEQQLVVGAGLEEVCVKKVLLKSCSRSWNMPRFFMQERKSAVFLLARTLMAWMARWMTSGEGTRISSSVASRLCRCLSCSLLICSSRTRSSRPLTRASAKPSFRSFRMCSVLDLVCARSQSRTLLRMTEICGFSDCAYSVWKLA